MSDAALQKTIRRCTALLVIALSSIAITLSPSTSNSGDGLFVLIAYVLFVGSILYLGWSIQLELFGGPVEASDAAVENEDVSEEVE
ncbi:hypothetical protein A4G99_22655 [Haladaptatus sp. R4]|uniref:hypothetical protein n=1 Tax=Haladaptatus sp. R4 TaxID=1679489 RepID=UPI0007B4C3BA|nr:hypothetical protein [Haladaptatus sp. R4]KZN26223.1 hypothetical protein A4G99_22655 [Haladaptatus sp. R4]